VLDPVDRAKVHPVIRWLMIDARTRADPSAFLEGFAHELRAAGVDVARIATGVPILHPHGTSCTEISAATRGWISR
jgi:hypothetical protein